MSIIPDSVPTGAIRYNTDSNKMECFDGTKWWQVSVSSPDLGNSTLSDNHGGTRGIFSQGMTPGGSITGKTDYINIATTGDAAEFDDTNSIYAQGCCSDRTRGLFAGGATPNSRDIDFVTIASTGTYADSGYNLTDAMYYYSTGLSNSTRGVFAGGFAPTLIAVSEYVTIQSLGNAVNFGNLSASKFGMAAFASPTRGLFCGGYTGAPANINVIDYITISSTGAAKDFGDLADDTNQAAGTSNSTRGIVFGGRYAPTQNIIAYITIATLGNAMDFGDLNNIITRDGGATASPTRAVFAGGDDVVTPANETNEIRYVSIATQGNSIDFGDLVQARNHMSGISSGHGGL